MQGKGGGTLYPTDGPPYVDGPHWQVRIHNPEGACDKWLVSVDPECIRKGEVMKTET